MLSQRLNFFKGNIRYFFMIIGNQESKAKTTSIITNNVLVIFTLLKINELFNSRVRNRAATKHIIVIWITNKSKVNTLLCLNNKICPDIDIKANTTINTNIK